MNRVTNIVWITASGARLGGFAYRYDAGTGRWLSKDPIGLSGGLNLYAFCNANAFDRDPYGLKIHDLTDKKLSDWLEKAYEALKKNPDCDQRKFDTNFWDGYERDVYWRYYGIVYRGDDINYVGIGMWDAYHNNSFWIPVTKTIAWKFCCYEEYPNDDVLMWTRIGYDWTKDRMLRELQQGNGGK